jgi:hypothetical protein
MTEPQGNITPEHDHPLERVRAAAANSQAARLAFDCAVDEAVAAGYSLRDVAGASDLSHTGVAKLVDRMHRTGRSLGVTRHAGRWRKDETPSVNRPPY